MRNESPKVPHHDEPQSSDTDEPENPERRRLLGGLAAVGMGLALPACTTAPSYAVQRDGTVARTAADDELDAALRARVRHIVVIYAENRSFANLYGHFPGVRQSMDIAAMQAPPQLDRDGKTPLPYLPPIWGGLVPQAQQVGMTRYMIGQEDILRLPNRPFVVPDAHGKPLPNAVITRDLCHRFYQNQMQINGGRNDQFVAWGDSGALVMGHYHNSAQTLRLWNIARQYTLCDNFFMAAFGGSWLNHIFLISAQAPFYPNIATSPASHLASVVEGDDPRGTRLKLAADNTPSALDAAPKFVRDGCFTPDGFAVNTMAPPYQPSFVPPAPGGDAAFADPSNPQVLPPQAYATIGDRLSEKRIDWAWYSGAWRYALEHRIREASPNFQYHHQPFNYFSRYAPGTAARERHLRDAGLGNDATTNRFIADIDAGRLPTVTFYKPQGNLNMHAGYADIESGDRHIATVIDHIRNGPQWANTVIVMTHDENGGWWDPVAPPTGDRWGPGSRIPALVIAPFAKKGFVDSTFYDTNSILRFIDRVHGLKPLDGVTARNDAFAARGDTPPGDLTGALELV
jgi:acid phosphatase